MGIKLMKDLVCLINIIFCGVGAMIHIVNHDPIGAIAWAAVYLFASVTVLRMEKGGED